MFRLLASAALLLAVQLAAAGAPGPPLSVVGKALQSDAVVVGKVTGVETEAVDVLPYPNAPAKVKANVATVKIETALLGAKNLTELKVLMTPPPTGPQPRPGRFGAVALTDGQDGLFFMTRHPTADGYFAVTFIAPPVGRTAPGFAQDVAEVKRIADAVADPLKALRAEKADDRLATACVLVEWYRRPPAGPSEAVALPKEETKAILKALLDADWSAQRNVRDYRLTPLVVLGSLNLSPGQPGGPAAVKPKPGEDYNALAHEAFKAWHAKNAGTFEIKKQVPKAK